MKYVILSTDANPDYYNLLPLVCYSWKKIGYKPMVITVGDVPKVVKDSCENAFFFECEQVDGVKDSTIAQLSRLFIYGKAMDDDILITGDADMVIAKDIFTASLPASYGFDLTGRSEIPMCYVAATAAQWRDMMGEYLIPNAARSEQWETYWSVDQQLLTQRAREYGFDRITFVDRGNNNKHGLPTGRWDRHDWANVPADIIDVHMKRNDWDAQFEVCKRLWPDDIEIPAIINAYRFKMEHADEIEELAWDKSIIRDAHQSALTAIANQYPWFLEDCSSWNNHRPMLLLGLSLTKGAVVELGSGDGSTEYLRDYCNNHDRPFRSFDGNKEWAEKTGAVYMDNWDMLIDNTKRNQGPSKFNPSLIFLDHAPGERRHTDAIALKDAADILVLHDTEEGGAGNYSWNKALPSFRYHLHYNRHGGGAGASMVSNTIDVTVYKGLTLGAFKFDD